MTRRARYVRTAVRAVFVTFVILAFVFLPDTLVTLLMGAP